MDLATFEVLVISLGVLIAAYSCWAMWSVPRYRTVTIIWGIAMFLAIALFVVVGLLYNR
jgi:hypothetical protein